MNDSFTAKLLANSDRYMNYGTKSRDLIDLAALRLVTKIPDDAINKASQTYFNVIEHLKAAVKNFQDRPAHREECYSKLEIIPANIPIIIDGIDLLAADLGLEKTKRIFKEQEDLFLLEPTNFMKALAQRREEIQTKKSNCNKNEP